VHGAVCTAYTWLLLEEAATGKSCSACQSSGRWSRPQRRFVRLPLVLPVLPLPLPCSGLRRCPAAAGPCCCCCCPGPDLRPLGFFFLPRNLLISCASLMHPAPSARPEAPAAVVTVRRRPLLGRCTTAAAAAIRAPDDPTGTKISQWTQYQGHNARWSILVRTTCRCRRQLSIGRIATRRLQGSSIGEAGDDGLCRWAVGNRLQT
jgi:hypothetical protein